jgi:hypothetical protein
MVSSRTPDDMLLSSLPLLLLSVMLGYCSCTKQVRMAYEPAPGLAVILASCS